MHARDLVAAFPTSGYRQDDPVPAREADEQDDALPMLADRGMA